MNKISNYKRKEKYTNTNKSGIYCILNNINHKRYIGQTYDLHYRRKRHESDLNGNRHPNNHLQSAWNIYGRENFTYIVLEKCSLNEIDEREIYWINYYDSINKGYNQCLGGIGCKGYKHTDEEILKMRQIQKPKAVLQYDENGIFICRWESASHAAKTLGYHMRGIKRCCERKVKTKGTGCFIWVYEDEKETVDISCYKMIPSKGEKRVAQYTLEMKLIKKNSTQIIDASIYLFSVSSHYRRLCNYFADMLTFDYIVAPYKMKDYASAHTDKFMKSYIKALDLLELMNIPQTYNNIARVVVREGVYYGYEIKTNESYMIQRFPHDKCKITSWEDGCPLFSLDMSYFDKNELLLESLGGSFKSLHNAYKKDSKQKWAELDGGSSVCILADETLSYIVPMFANTFVDIYGIQDFKDLAVTREEQDLYKMLSLKYPIDKDTGAFLMEKDIAEEFYMQMANQLPQHIGLALNPFELDEIKFPQSTVDRDSTAVAERNFWTAAGVSSLLFNNEKASSTALQESVINDMTLMLPILRSLERWTNKKLKALSGTYKFKTNFLNVSHYTKRLLLDTLRKDEQYGAPVKSLICALSGLSPNDILSMTYLENDVLDLNNKFIPPKSANTQSPGRPSNESKGEGLSESGEKTAETGANDNRAE